MWEIKSLTEDQYWQKESFCPVAWRGVYVDPTGRVDNCCISDNRLGDLNNSPIGDVLQGPRAIEIRQSMIDGKLPDGCRVCCNGESDNLRVNFLNKFIDHDREIYDDVRGFRLNYLDLRWRNTCNSACVYCGPELSSRIAAEQGIEIRSDTSTIDATKRFIVENIGDIKHIYLAGGEPLLIRENEWLLETLIDRDLSPNILVNTNLSTINNRVFDLLCKFPNVTWMISGEHVGEHYEYIRYGSRWETFDRNLETLIDIVGPKNHDYIFNLVYFILNLDGFWQYTDWIKSKNLKKYQVHPAWIGNGNSDPFDPRRLPIEHSEKVRHQLAQKMHYGDDIDRPLAKFLLESWLHPQDNTGGLFPTQNQLTKFDRRRGLDSQRLWPEIWNSINSQRKEHESNRERNR